MEDAEALGEKVVLLIEEDDPVISGLQRSLGCAGIEVVYSRLQDVLGILQEQTIAVAIVDCHPPTRERRALIRELRGDDVQILFTVGNRPAM